MSTARSFHIVFLCSGLNSPGGIERAIVNTANLLSAHENKITLLVLDENRVSFYPLHAAISIRNEPLFFGIGVKGSVLSRKLDFYGDVRRLKAILSEIKPDVVVATEYPFSIAAVLAGSRRHSPILAWEHHHYFELKRSRFWQALFRYAYPKLNAVVCLNADEKKLFEKHNRRVEVIPNFCVDPSPQTTPVKRQKVLLTIGRLTPVKGMDRLLAVALKLLPRHPNWKWKIIGEGEWQDKMLSFIRNHQLEDQLILQAPVSPNVEGEYRKASLYVMTSQNECLPMTLLEAMQESLPCVAFDCPTGPKAIIRHGRDGLLVEDGNVEKMYAALNELLSKPEWLNAMRDAAREVLERFSARKALKSWMDLFNTL